MTYGPVLLYVYYGERENQFLGTRVVGPLKICVLNKDTA
jgi:hypothetical protein